MMPYGSLSYSWGFHRPIQQLFILGRWSIFTLEHYARKLYCLLRVSRGIRPVYISVTFVGKWDFPQPQGTCAQEASPQICMGTPCLPDLRAWALFTTTWWIPCLLRCSSSIYAFYRCCCFAQENLRTFCLLIKEAFIFKKVFIFGLFRAHPHIWSFPG